MTEVNTKLLEALKTAIDLLVKHKVKIPSQANSEFYEAIKSAEVA